MAETVYRATTRLLGDLRVEVNARQHTIILDEPKEAGSTDEGMTPVEALLGALGACKCIVLRAFAQAHGIDLKSVEVHLEGDFNADGYLGKDPEAKIGFSAIRSVYTFESDAPREKLEAFIEFVDKTCPVADTIINTPQLESKLVVKKPQ